MRDEPKPDDRQRFDDVQFALQLELEYLATDGLREHGKDYRQRADLAGLSRQERLDLSLRVLLALKGTPSLGPFEAEERFVVWCGGFGIPAEELFKEFSRMIQRLEARGHNRPL